MAVDTSSSVKPIWSKWSVLSIVPNKASEAGSYKVWAQGFEIASLINESKYSKWQSLSIIGYAKDSEMNFIQQTSTCEQKTTDNNDYTWYSSK